MKAIACFFALTLSLAGCNAQDKQQEANAREGINKELNDGKKAQPKGSWSVTRELDEQGNLIRYDSIYSYSYSSENGDRGTIKNVDSVIQSFRNYFDDRIPENWDKNFMNPYWNDSLRFDDFFNEDYFYDRWKNDFFDMESRFRYMDSLRNKFFEDFQPDYYNSKPENDKIPTQKT